MFVGPRGRGEAGGVLVPPQELQREGSWFPVGNLARFGELSGEIFFFFCAVNALLVHGSHPGAFEVNRYGITEWMRSS